MRQATLPSKNRTQAPAADSSAAALFSPARITPCRNPHKGRTEEPPARPSRKKTCEPPPRLERSREILLAETLQHAKQELLNTLLCSRAAIYWLTETAPRKSGLDLDKPAQIALRRLMEKGDIQFAEAETHSSARAREALADTVHQIRKMFADRKFQVSRMDTLFDTLHRSQFRMRHLRDQIAAGDSSAWAESRALERQLWMREEELDDFFAHIKKWETLFLQTRSALVVANLPLVPWCANRFSGARVAFEDLVQEGYVALTLAVENYRADLSKFSTFAMKVISSAMIRAIDDQSHLIRIPVHACEKLRKIQKQSEALRKDLGRDPTDREVARACDLSLQKVKELRAAAQTPLSLDTHTATLGDPDSESLAVPQTPAYSTGTSTEDSGEALAAIIHQRLNRLSPLQREVVERIYGLGNFEVCSETKVAQSLRRTETQVRGILSTALKIMAGPEPISTARALSPEEEMLGIAA